tara:strand:+ start:3528 stop:3995 length:468 start_codon:yes stop_codon:yes gene_type:complete
MKISEFKNIIAESSEISFQLENGNIIPQHFHITEIGLNEKKFIDCGGVVRNENIISLQLWHANDFDHKLNPNTVLDIIDKAEKILKIGNLDVEIEYQQSTIGKYNVGFNGLSFVLEAKTTACLAEDNCGIPAEKLKVPLSNLQNNSSCSPESGCC